MEFIEISKGIWYETSTGLPWTTRQPGGPKGGCKYDAPLKRLIAKTNKGYYMVRLDGRRVYWHRIVFEFFHGPIPKGLQVDHKNNKPEDNRLENLQLLSAKENYRCQLKNKNNTSGYPGIYWHKRDKKWRAQIKVNGDIKYLGCFDNPKEGYKVYLAAKIRYHGEESVRHLSLT